MTVAELIAHLQTKRPDALVVLPDTASDLKIYEPQELRAVKIRLLAHKGMGFVQFFEDDAPEGERWERFSEVVDAVILE